MKNCVMEIWFTTFLFCPWKYFQTLCKLLFFHMLVKNFKDACLDINPKVSLKIYKDYWTFKSLFNIVTSTLPLGMIGTMYLCLGSTQSSSSSSRMWYLWVSKLITILLSNNARYWPKQFLGPSTKGKKVYGDGWVENLVGSNSMGFFQKSGLWWTLWMLTIIVEPSGSESGPTCKREVIRLVTVGTTEYFRSASCEWKWKTWCH